MSNTTSYYKTCSTCSQPFSVRYFNRHVCASSQQAFQRKSHDREVHQDDESVGTQEENILNFEHTHDHIGRVVHEEDVQESLDERSDEIDDIDDDDDEEEENSDSGGFNNYDNWNFAEEYFNDLLEESFIDVDYENLSVNVLLKWMLLFLARWQKSFNITDTSLELLLKFLAIYINVILKEKFEDRFIEQYKKDFPKTIYSFRKLLSLDVHTFEKFVVCIKCNSLYPINQCIVRRGGEKVSKECSYVKYPEHPQRQHRRKCGQVLMKKNSAVPNNFVPLKTYCYRSIKNSLKTFLENPDFENLCEKWRQQIIPEHLFADIYDGNIWKTFSKDGQWFFGSERNYGIMLNCDWFQPFKHISNFSIGAIYVVFLNLPRHLRFKRENVALVGIIPDMPKEPPTNSFLEPLVEELGEAWADGFRLFSGVSKKEECFHLALLCVGCDIPASRKLCGFLGHAATRGCSKCNRLFPGQVGEKNFGGFDISSWVPRTNQEHRNQMMEILAAKTQTNRYHLESLYGTRFTVLALLPYFDAVRMNIVDPMHNLFLGTAKDLLRIWKEKGYLNKNMLQNIQEKADSFMVPFDIGKISRKIISGFDNFNADEYKNWTLLFSIFCLADVIPKNDLECLRKFVLASHYLCRKSITRNDVTIAHQLLLRFCQLFEGLYGQERVTPNMQLHLHLKDCILDYGPIYSFWLFSFERYNGMLGNIPHNKRNIELQIISRFCAENLIDNIVKPEDYRQIFNEIFSKLESKNTARGTLLDMESQSLLEVGKLSSRLTDVSSQSWYNYSEVIQPLQEMKVCSFSAFEKEILIEVYKHLYPNIDLDGDSFCYSYEKVHDIKLLENRYSSSSSRNCSSSFVMAYWPGTNGRISSYRFMDLLPHPGRIKYFVKHSLILENRTLSHWFAVVDWFLPVEDHIRFKFGKPTELWYRTLTIQYGSGSFIPVQRILCKFVHSKYEFRSKDLMVVVPRVYTTS